MLKEDFLKRMQEYLKEDYEAFIKSYDEENIRSLRVNTNYLNKEEFLKLKDFKTSPLFEVPNAFIVSNDLKFGFHPLHHAGAFYLQDPSAMLPALTYPIKNGSLILDLCAAPGGKTTQLASLNPDGVVFANEIDNKRAWALNSNIERLGFKNVIITNNDAEAYLKGFENSFDLILIDAPCSGEGMFRKYKEYNDLWSLDNVLACQKRDKDILDKAIRLLKKEGILIYSTCTFSKEEDEMMVDYLINKHHFKLLDIVDSLKPYVKEGFKKQTYRVYPQDHFGEGQFMAVLKKEEGEVSYPKLVKEMKAPKEFLEFEKSSLKENLNHLIFKNDNLYYQKELYDLSGLKVLNYGVKLGNIKNKRFIPEHQFFKAFSNSFISSLNLDYKDPLVLKYLHGEEIPFDVIKGYGVLKINNIPLGGYKASNQVLKNYYPKGLRNF